MTGEDLAHRFFDAIQSGDRALLAQLCADDAVVWHNYDRVERPFGALAEVMCRLPSLLTGFRYAERRYLSVPDGAVLQHALTGRLPDGTELSVPMMVRVFCRESRIVRFEEYLDPAGTAPLLEALSAGAARFVSPA